MVSVHLDTSFMIRSFQGDTPECRAVQLWLADGAGLAVSSIVWAEFLCGPLTSDHAEVAARMFEEIIPFSLEGAKLAARLFQASGRRRGSLADCMIAASAISAGAALATSHLQDFRRHEPFGLKLKLVAEP